FFKATGAGSSLFSSSLEFSQSLNGLTYAQLGAPQPGQNATEAEPSVPGNGPFGISNRLAKPKSSHSGAITCGSSRPVATGNCRVPSCVTAARSASSSSALCSNAKVCKRGYSFLKNFERPPALSLAFLRFLTSLPLSRSSRLQPSSYC